MSLGPVTHQRAYLQNLSGCAKKNGASFRLLKRNQNGFLFWRERAHAKCAATDRFFQPKLENSVVWAILFRVVFDFVQNAHEKNTCYFCNAMNLLILSVFMLDRQTWFQNGQLGKHNMFATIEYDPPKKPNAKHFFANITNWHSCLNRQSNLNHWTQFPWMQHFLDRFALQFALQLDLHRRTSGPGSCGCHAVSTNRARGDLLRFSLRWGVHAGGFVSETFRWVPRLRPELDEGRIRSWGNDWYGMVWYGMVWYVM